MTTLPQLRERIQQHYSKLNTYDQDFVTDMLYMMELGEKFSQRQFKHMLRIVNRINKWEEQPCK
jgi:hypothetical protein